MAPTPQKQEIVFVEKANPAEPDSTSDDGNKAEVIDEQMAIEATLSEHNLTTWQALVKYRKAAAWSMLVSLSIIMRAYDIEITGNFFALPAFKRHFGEELPTTDTRFRPNGKSPCPWVPS